MIFYFTGTGNSFFVANQLGIKLKENILSISKERKKNEPHYHYVLKKEERIGFVFPVYSWGPPKMVLDFIHKLSFNQGDSHYVFAVVTCGRSIGNTFSVFEKAIRKIGLNLDGKFTLIMPNNYVILGNVDSKKKEQKKLAQCEIELQQIENSTNDRSKSHNLLHKGLFPRLLTGVVNPMFNKYEIEPSQFHVNESCTGCGICAKVCNGGNITVDKIPSWGNTCSMCLACLHFCPMKAIDYGKTTIKKVRYTNPNVKWEDLI